MHHRRTRGRWLRVGLLAAGCLVIAAAVVAAPAEEETMQATRTKRASGAFDVAIAPQATDAVEEGSALGRLALDKRYQGELAAAGKGEMLTVETTVEGSGAYVAVERVSGTLDGRRGTFALQHSGTMQRGAPQLSITIVPDSGTGELTGISGRLTVRIESGGKHFYDLEYTLPR